MSNGWAFKEIALSKQISGVVTNEPVTVATRVSAAGALNGIIELVVTGVTQVGTITPKLQTANGESWVDVKSGTAITANGTQYIRWNIQTSADQSILPLLNKLRVVITTTNSGDAVTVSSCSLLQGL